MSKQREWVHVTLELIKEKILQEMYRHSDVEILDVKYDKDTECVAFKVNKGYETPEGSVICNINYDEGACRD